MDMLALGRKKRDVPKYMTLTGAGKTDVDSISVIFPRISAKGKTQEKPEVREELLYILATALYFFWPLSKGLNHPSKASSHCQAMVKPTGNVTATCRSPTHTRQQRKAKAGSCQALLPYPRDANTNSLAIAADLGLILAMAPSPKVSFPSNTVH